jgi:hypothetical protein
MGCGSGSPESTGVVRIALQVLGPDQSATAADVCGNTLDSAQLVIRDLKLQRAEDTAEELDVEVGPYLIDLTSSDFNGTLQQGVIEAELPVGEYDEVRFKIHKLDDGDPQDVAAADADPGLAQMMDLDLSIALAGALGDATDFSFESSVDERQDVPASISVGDSVTGIDGITLTIDPATWFLREGGGCLDPTVEEDHGEIEQNLKDSIKVEEDDDADGLEDS